MSRASLWRSDRAIAAVALLLLIVAGTVAYGGESNPATPYSSASTSPDGTRALYMWLGALGFSARRVESWPDDLAALRALVVLQPQGRFSPDEVAATLRWVRSGGVLILLQDGGDIAMVDALHLRLTPLNTGPSFVGAQTPYGAAPVQPLLFHPPLHGLSVQASAAIAARVPGVITILGSGGMRTPNAAPGTPMPAPDPKHSLLVYEAMSRGRVYAGTVPGVLTNGEIATGENRRLIPNLLAGLPAGSAVGFDEYHLIDRSASAGPATLGEALVGTGWGRATLYATVLAALYITLTSRRLGKPLRPIPERGRSLAEYVISMGAIFRRAGLRERVLGLWQNDLRNTLAGAGGVRGRPDSDLIAEAVRRAGLTSVDEAEARTLLQPRVSLSEGMLVDLCGRIARLQQRIANR